MDISASAGLGALIAKFGFIKIASLGAAVLGAAMMAVFRPPVTRKELFLQGAVALGTSLLLGGAAVTGANYYLHWITEASSFEDILQFSVAVHGLLGAFAWGIFGGLAVLRDRFTKDPLKTIQEVKDVAK